MKNNKKISGNALSQYTIIIVLVGLALVPVFFVTGQYLFKNFESFSSLLKGNQVETKPIITQKTNDSSIISEQQADTNYINNNETTNDKESINNTGAVNENISTIQAGEPENAPVVKCNGGNCSIDYGDFVLNGIPEDFGSFVEASGTSGGTEKLAAILEQIAVQLEQKGDTAGSKDFRDMANIGHVLAKFDASMESDLTERMKMYPGGTIFYPPQIDLTESDIKILKETQLGWSFGDSLKAWMGSEFDGTSMSANPLLGQMYDYRNRIDNGKYSDNMKAVARNCYDNIVKLNRYTGVIYSESVSAEDANNFIHPKPSKGTNSNASIICITGFNKDNGYQCRK